MELMEKILSRENMLSALKAVKRNKGAAGIDKVTVGELDEYFRRNWTEMKAAILEKKSEGSPQMLYRLGPVSILRYPNGEIKKVVFLQKPLLSLVK